MSTSDNPERSSYKLLKDELVHITVGSLFQEKDLEFDREGRHDRILGDGSHLQIMRHNCFECGDVGVGVGCRIYDIEPVSSLCVFRTKAPLTKAESWSAAHRCQE